MSDKLSESFAMFEKLLNVCNKLIGMLVDNSEQLYERIAELSVRVKAIEDKLDYRKQAQKEKFIPPKNSQNRGKK